MYIKATRNYFPNDTDMHVLQELKVYTNWAYYKTKRKTQDIRDSDLSDKKGENNKDLVHR